MEKTKNIKQLEFDNFMDYYEKQRQEFIKQLKKEKKEKEVTI